MAGLLSPVADENPVPQMPNQAPINKTPNPVNGSVVAPQVPSKMPPNVNGTGQADFSDSTAALADFVRSQQTELATSVEAYERNANVDKQTMAALSGITDETLKAYGNVKKAAGLPGGADGEVAQLFSLFNSDYNKEVQLNTILMNQTNASRITATAAAQKEINNALPAMQKKVTEATHAVFGAQLDANKLFVEAGKLKNEQLRTQIEKTRLGLEMSREQRARAEFMVNSASMDELRAQLPAAQAGKGKFAGLAGFMEHHIVAEQSAQTSLDKLTLDLKKGNRQDYNEGSVDFVSHLPVDVTTQLLQKAQAGNQLMVSFPAGKDEKGKPQTLDIPFNLVQEGLVKAGEYQDKANGYVAADLSQRLDVVPTATKIMRGAGALASMDPRASQIAAQSAAIMKGLDMKNPGSVRQVGLLLKENEKALDKIAKENAAQFTSKDAQAGVVKFINSGRFDATGGTAVVADSVGTAALSNNAKYKNAWGLFSTKLAQAIQKQDKTVPNVDPTQQSNSQQIMTYFMNKGPSGKTKISDLTTELLSDPVVQAEVGAKVKGTIQGGAVRDVVRQLANQPKAQPIWNNILQHPEQFQTNGRADPAKLFASFEQASVLSGGKVNYADAFLSGLRNYAHNADETTSTDPTYTLQDHALEASLFGGAPHQAVLGDLHYQLRSLSQKAKAEMQQRIRDDITGKTQKEAAAVSGFGPTLDAFTGPAGIITDYVAEKMNAKTGLDVNNVPSSTGTGMSVGQIKALYGNKGP